MKGHEKFLIATGFAAFILAIVFAVITVFSFIGAIRNEVDGEAFRQSIENGVEYIRDHAEDLNVRVSDDSVQVDIPGIDIDVET